MATRSKRRSRNPGRHASGSPSVLIRTYSTALLTGDTDVYLVMNQEGDVMDAIVTDPEDFGPVRSAGYGSLGILDLDVSAAQHRKLRKLAKQLEKQIDLRPVFRPGSSGAEAFPEPTGSDRPASKIRGRGEPVEPWKSPLFAKKPNPARLKR